LTVFIVLLAATSGALAFREHNPAAEYRNPPFTGDLPPCSDAFVLNEITSSFARREAEFWNSALIIEGFEKTAEFGFRTNGLSYIPRRYCRADAIFNDGKRREVVYNIGEGLGFIGLSYGVTWCVQGLDRNHAFSPNCHAAGP
jgi:hypothetical protein